MPLKHVGFFKKWFKSFQLSLRILYAEIKKSFGTFFDLHFSKFKAHIFGWTIINISNLWRIICSKRIKKILLITNFIPKEIHLKSLFLILISTLIRGYSQKFSESDWLGFFTVLQSLVFCKLKICSRDTSFNFFLYFLYSLKHA